MWSTVDLYPGSTYTRVCMVNMKYEASKRNTMDTVIINQGSTRMYRQYEIVGSENGFHKCPD